MIRRPPRSTQSRSSAASDVYKRQVYDGVRGQLPGQRGVEALGGFVVDEGADPGGCPPLIGQECVPQLPAVSVTEHLEDTAQGHILGHGEADEARVLRLTLRPPQPDAMESNASLHHSPRPT